MDTTSVMDETFARSTPEEIVEALLAEGRCYYPGPVYNINFYRAIMNGGWTAGVCDEDAMGMMTVIVYVIFSTTGQHIPIAGTGWTKNGGDPAYLENFATQIGNIISIADGGFRV